LCYNTDTKREEQTSTTNTHTEEITTMYDWDYEIREEQKATKKRWNGKVITTGRQWAENAHGALEPMNASYDKIWDAVRDYQDSRQWN
jgi:hypothetical protein